MPAPADLKKDYGALVTGPAWVDRSDRALLEVTGKDRITWAHNLTTNQVKTLTPGEGNYAFVLNVQGRILFDVVVLVRADAIWMDLDSQWLSTALAHFNKYLIMEDVRLIERTRDFRRIGLVGPGARDLLARWGAGQAGAMGAHAMARTTLDGVGLEFSRNDFCGEFGVDLFVPVTAAPVIEATIRIQAVEVDPAAVEVRRIEAGIPRSGSEITDEVLAAETRQLERAVSFQKGCYLGQEIVERMRARKVVARLLCGLEIQGDSEPVAGSEVVAADGAVVGKVTSACHSVALGRPIALGYIKAASAGAGTAVTVRKESWQSPAVVTALPFVPPAAA